MRVYSDLFFPLSLTEATQSGLILQMKKQAVENLIKTWVFDAHAPPFLGASSYCLAGGA